MQAVSTLCLHYSHRQKGQGLVMSRREGVKERERKGAREGATVSANAAVLALWSNKNKNCTEYFDFVFVLLCYTYAPC